MRGAALYAALALTLLSCNRGAYGVATHRGRDGRPDQWVRGVSGDEYQIAIDANGDGKPDLIKDVKRHRILGIESDWNIDGQVDGDS